MSDELRLPDHLAACEARLAAQPLVPSALNRDELLYRAGWEAAVAELARNAASSTAAGVGKRRTIAWSAASSAIAASIAVLATLSLASRSDEQTPAIAAVPPETPSLVASPGDSPKASPPRMAGDPFLARLDALIGGARRAYLRAPAATLWALSRPMPAGRWDEPILTTADVSSTVAIAPTEIEHTTAKDLLDQYLPRGRGPSADAKQASPGVMRFLRPLGWGDTI